MSYYEHMKDYYDRREEIRPLNREQVRALFEAASGDRLEALYIVAVTAGLRRGKLLGLRWDDVDLEAGTLQVRRTLSEPKGGYVFSRLPSPARAGASGSPARPRWPSGSTASAS